MIKFDPAQVEFSIVKLKTISTVLGGSMHVVDEDSSTDKKEVLKRISVPLSVARMFIEATKITKYIKPVPVCLMWYGDQIVAMERSPIGAVLDETMPWVPTCKSKYHMQVEPVVRMRQDWYFDGRYVYRLPGDTIKQAVTNSPRVSSDGNFRKVTVGSFDLQKLPLSNDVTQVSRDCIGFIASSGAIAVTPPVWKDAAMIGSSAIGRFASADDEFGLDDDLDDAEGSKKVDISTLFDQIDEKATTNLSFALKAGAMVGKMVGYERVEALNLPRMMVELCTVNLPGVPKWVKSTYDTGMPFTHALAWLMGMLKDVKTYGEYTELRSLLKYLTQRGMMTRRTYDPENIFVDGAAGQSVPMSDLSELLEKPNQVLISELLAKARRNRKQNDQAGEE